MDIMVLPESVRTKIEIQGDCWIWTACVVQNYGQVRFEGRRWKSHRLVYTLLVGPIPDGLQLDHVRARGCNSKLCCNPAHLEPVTALVNMRRWMDKITHCPQNHEYTEENTSICKRGNRSCRECRRIRDREYYRTRGMAL